MKRSISTIVALLVVPLTGSLGLAPSAQAASAPQAQERPAVGALDAAQPGPAGAGIGSAP